MTAHPGQGSNNQAEQLLRDELGLYATLLDILKNEQQALIQGAVEDLTRITHDKTTCVEHINIIEKDRARFVQKSSTNLPPPLHELWHTLTRIADEARELNLANGRLINTRLQRTQDALAVLRTNDERDPTYGRDGQTSPPGNGRPLASA